jgi:hypothetical protein
MTVQHEADNVPRAPWAELALITALAVILIIVAQYAW